MSEPDDTCAEFPGKTLAAVVTAPGRSALATVQVQGPDATRAVAALCNLRCRIAASGLSSHQLVTAQWRGHGGEQVVIRFREPQLVEIHCHGGAIAARTVLEDLRAGGVESVAWPELVGCSQQSLVEQEAVELLARAERSEERRVGKEG